MGSFLNEEDLKLLASNRSVRLKAIAKTSDDIAKETAEFLAKGGLVEVEPDAVNDTTSVTALKRTGPGLHSEG